MTVWRATVRITSDVLGGTGVNTWHINDEADGSSDTTLNDWIDALEDFYNAINDYIGVGTTFTFNGEIVSADGAEGVLITGLHTWSVVSGTTTQSLPPATCICVGWKTAAATRSGRGRTFLNPISQDVLDVDGTPKSTPISDIDQAAEAYLVAAEAITDITPVVWSPTHNSSREIVSSTTRKKFAVLRSRRD